MANEIRCKSCGEKCLDTDSYCPTCHASLINQGKCDEAPVENIEISLWRRFIGDKSEAYLKIFRKFEGKDFFLSFNPFAFLFKSAWFFYRKMYVQAFFIEVVAHLYVGFLSAIAQMGAANRIDLAWIFAIIPAAFLFPTILGFIGPAVYKRHIMKKIAKNDMTSGGTALAPVLIASIIVSVLDILCINELLTVFFLRLMY